MGARDNDTLELEQDDLPVEQNDLRSSLEDAFDEVEAAETEAVEGDEHQDLDADGQPRDERGRWTKAQREHFEEQERQQQAAQEAQDGQQQPGQGELRLAAPHGWSPAAKAAYAKLPPEVQEAVARREVEVNNGFRKLQEYKPLEEYMEMAKANGTTVKEALDRFIAAENLFEQDFIGGTEAMCQMYGIHPMQLAHQIVMRYQGGGQRASAMDPNTALMARKVAAMEEEFRTLKSERERAEDEGINSYLQQFADEHTYYEDVRQDMGDLIRTGKVHSLEEAYDKACWMNPQIRELLIKEQSAPQEADARVSRARRASGSLPTGAPAGRTSGGSQSNSLRDDLEEAWGGAQI